MVKFFELKLIDGTFNPADAKELLINLYSDKIKFHQLKNFSAHERAGAQDARSSLRIAELQSCKDLITQVMTGVSADRQFRLHSTIHIELIEENEN